MAKSRKKTNRSAAAESDDNVVRIKAGGASSKKAEKPADKTASAKEGSEKPAKAKKVRSSTKGIRGMGMFRSIGGYFKGAWVELRQVRWPNRRATWSLTGAVLVYTAFFVVIILALDAGFQYLFELILGK